MEAIKKVNKEDYHVHQFISGYYGICEQSSGGGCVYGGDSACEDHYNEDYINDVYEQWDGTLHYTGEKYGYKIEAFPDYSQRLDYPQSAVSLTNK